MRFRVRVAALLGTAGGLRRCTGGAGAARLGDAVLARGGAIRDVSVKSTTDAAAAGMRRISGEREREESCGMSSSCGSDVYSSDSSKMWCACRSSAGTEADPVPPRSRRRAAGAARGVGVVAEAMCGKLVALSLVLWR